MNAPFLIVGLGNPGKKYEGTRHNIGFTVLDAIAQYRESRIKNLEWQRQPRLHAKIITREISEHRVMLARPTTYMNGSGKAVAALVRKFQIPDSRFQILILHDDLDLPTGALRLSVGGSSGGQKGVQSIIDALGTEEFLRLRIGIGPNAAPDGVRIPAEDFVLKRFPKKDREHIDAAIACAVETVAVLLREGVPAAQQLANGNN